MFYTILFTDGGLQTSGMMVVRYDGKNSPIIVRHAHVKDGDYERAYLLGKDGFPFREKPFYVRLPGELGKEKECALLALFRDCLVW